MIRIMKNKFVITISTIIILLIALLFAEIINVNNYENVYAKNSQELTSAKGMAVMEVSSKRVLYSKNEKEKMPMASTTKIITAIVVLENVDDISRVVQIDKSMTGIEGTSIYLKAGERLTIEELLYGLMLRSGNDAAVALAIATSGSVDKFVELMNKFCQKVGALDTNIKNPHGLPDDDHYTTAYDLALISSYALNNEKFANIVKTRQKIISNSLSSEENRVLINKNKLLKNMKYSTGIKTGYTKKAGRCFVGSAEREGMQIVCVLLHCRPMFEECQDLLERAFMEYKMIKVVDANNIVGESKILGGMKDSVKVATRKDVFLPIKVSEVDSVDIAYDFLHEINAPHSTFESVGKFDIYASKNLIFSDNLYIIENVEKRLVKRSGRDIVKNFVHAG